MHAPPRLSKSIRSLFVFWLASLCPANALSYYISYVQDESKRAAVVAAMDSAVAVYNATTNIDVNIQVKWLAGVPTAQSGYNNELAFGGSISTQVALHEIAHYLGSGTYRPAWPNNFNGNVWAGPALVRYIKLFDGPGGKIYKSDPHYYPYGFNYASEDSPIARYRLPRLIQAMRVDLGIQDGDGDGMSDEWERYKLGTTALTAAGDADGDGISNYDEWWTDGEPLRSVPVRNGHIYQIRSRLSQMLVETDGAQAGANVRQGLPDGSDFQKWTATNAGGGYWKFTNLAGGKVLETFGQNTTAGGQVTAWHDLGNDNQQWRLFAQGEIYWKVFNNRSMNLVLDVDGGAGATGDKTNISQYTDDLGATNQEWAFDDVTPGVPAGGLVAEYKLDANARETSGRALAGMELGGVTYGAGRIDGRAAIFNGTNAAIRVPASADRNFTIACWVKSAATAPGGQWFQGMGIVDAEVGGVKADFGLAMVGSKAAFGTGGPDSTMLSAASINDNVWHHLAATLKTATGARRLYVDGVLSASGTGPAGVRTAPNSFSLGAIDGRTGFFNGSIDEVRIYDEILGLQEIARLADIGGTRLARYDFEGDAADSTGFGNEGDASGITWIPGKSGASAARFDGVASFAKIPAVVSGDFSVAFWMRTTATAPTGQWYAGKSIVDAEIPGVADDWGIALLGGKVGFGIGNPDKTILSTTSVNNGAWHRIVASRSAATGAMKLFVDGALESSATGPTADRSAAAFLRVGSTLYGGSFFQGDLDELQFFSYPLGTAQVAALGGPLPGGLTSTDVGISGSDGYASFNAATGKFDIAGGGPGIDGGKDRFQFASTPATGNRVVIARLEIPPLDESGTTPAFAKAGLMLRATTAADSIFAGVFYDHQRGLRLLKRPADGFAVVQTGATVPLPVGSLPVWLRLARVGDQVFASYATTVTTPSDAAWQPIGDTVVFLRSAPLGGLAVTSQTPAVVAAAHFGNFSSTGLLPGPAWRLANFGTTFSGGNSADASDPDGDGITNLLERALGNDPNVPGPGPAGVVEGDFLTLTYPRSLAATDLDYQAEWSPDLRIWTTTGVLDSLLSTDAKVEIHKASVPFAPSDTPAGFLRLRVK